MPLSICMRCGGEFLPPSRAVHWHWCAPCSAEIGSGVSPYTNPERDWSDWNMDPAAPFYGYVDDDEREPDPYQKRRDWIREWYRWR